MIPTIHIKRIYEPSDKTDGFRILVDRLWPRGMKKEDAEVDLWMKEAAPSASLRKWFGHDPARWKEFEKKYKGELTNSETIHEMIAELKKHKTITFLYSARDQQHNQALVLQDFVKGLLK